MPKAAAKSGRFVSPYTAAAADETVNGNYRQRLTLGSGFGA